MINVSKENNNIVHLLRLSACTWVDFSTENFKKIIKQINVFQIYFINFNCRSLF